MLGTSNACGAGWVVPAQLLREGRAIRFPAEADRRRSLSAGIAGTGREARVGGVHRLLPPGPHQAVHHGQRSGGGDAGRDARTRRSRPRLFHPGRTDRPGEEQSQAAPGAGGVRQLVAAVPGVPEPVQPVPRQARAPGDQPCRRSRRDQRRRVRRHGRGRRQLDQRRRRIRPEMAEVAARPRQGEAVDGRGRRSQRVQRGLGDADAELLFAWRAHRVAASGDRHPSRGCR